MLYTKPIDAVGWSDVEVFCQERIAEGAYLDYKMDFPRHLQRTIAAMGNTFGGLILIGVEEDDENKPVLPVQGMEFRRGLSERVTSIILANVVPPLFPEIAVCRDESGQRAVVVIRVPQSHQTPHAIASNTKVYLRTGDVNSPERLGTVDEIKWLNEGRGKSVALRKALRERAEARFSSFLERDPLRVFEVDAKSGEAERTEGLLTLSVCPTYPKRSYAAPPELVGIRERIRVADHYGPFSTYGFPPQQSRAGSATIVQDGVVFALPSEPESFYTEVNSFGLYLYRQAVSQRPAETVRGPNTDVLRAGELFSRIHQFLDSAKKLYDEIGYWGYVDLAVGLDRISECCLYLDWLSVHRGLAYGAPHGFSPDEKMLHLETLLVSSLATEQEQLFLRCCQRIAWTFGIDLTPEHLAVARWQWPVAVPKY